MVQHTISDRSHQALTVGTPFHQQIRHPIDNLYKPAPTRVDEEKSDRTLRDMAVGARHE